MSRRRPRSQRRSEYQRAVRPAFRHGINATPVTLPEADFGTLGEWAEDRFGAEGARAFDRGDVFYDFSVPANAADPYRPGQRVWLFRPVPDEPAEPIILDVVHRGPRFMVVDKPHGIATIPRGMYVAKSVTIAARRQFSNDDVVAAHRLDAETAGLVLLTGEPRWRGAYQDMFAKRAVTKVYVAVAPVIDLGGGEDGWLTVDLRLEREPGALAVSVVDGEPNARTHIRLARELGDGLALYELRPISGRLHQLRATMNHLGAPIVGDPLYPTVLSLEETAARDLPTQLLATELAFTDPVDGSHVHVRTRRRLALAPDIP
ncbi:pseudouridine synthase [Trueperella bialowiezensis]|uniref:RNA pseudouridylate synthase n=1 Tax=Trueperella bialowiezensis TaxID=312285 RepID=A0A448PCY8_9ACTO|nr:pseudouridine synthase [Trueperella bialowiezensis]VEI12778.1 Ribosomal large subunit pseudouridine synthase A [Trueperella bialowiezensis]